MKPMVAITGLAALALLSTGCHDYAYERPYYGYSQGYAAPGYGYYAPAGYGYGYGYPRYGYGNPYRSYYGNPYYGGGRGITFSAALPYG